MRIYLTDCIFIEDDIYFHEKNGKIIKINENNWHIHLNEYGWNKLNRKWIIMLNKLMSSKNKNSTYGVLDCGGGGNCLFECINNGLQGGYTFDTNHLRDDLSRSITYDIFKQVIELYKVSYISGDFEENWDPFTMTFNTFKEKIKNGGNEYWGDSIILDLLKVYLNINVAILYNNDITNEYYYYPLLHNYNKELDTIILLYENDNHFKLIGTFQGHRMITLFNNENMPNELLKLINKIR